MVRTPSPELVRFLLSNEEYKGLTLGQLKDKLGTFSEERWQCFSQTEIEKDLNAAIAANGSDRAIYRYAKPVAICIFDDGQQGKTTLCHLLKHQGIPVFATDPLFSKIRDGQHHFTHLGECALRYHTGNIDQFILLIEKDSSLVKSYVDAFFEFIFTTHPKPLCVIEGFVHHPHNGDSKPIQSKMIQRIRSLGYKVWKAKKAK